MLVCVTHNLHSTNPLVHPFNTPPHSTRFLRAWCPGLYGAAPAEGNHAAFLTELDERLKNSHNTLAAVQRRSRAVVQQQATEQGSQEWQQQSQPQQQQAPYQQQQQGSACHADANASQPSSQDGPNTYQMRCAVNEK